MKETVEPILKDENSILGFNINAFGGILNIFGILFQYYGYLVNPKNEIYFTVFLFCHLFLLLFHFVAIGMEAWENTAKFDKATAKIVEAFRDKFGKTLHKVVVTQNKSFTIKYYTDKVMTKEEKEWLKDTTETRLEKFRESLYANRRN